MSIQIQNSYFSKETALQTAMALLDAVLHIQTAKSEDFQVSPDTPRLLVALAYDSIAVVSAEIENENETPPQ